MYFNNDFLPKSDVVFTVMFSNKALCEDSFKKKYSKTELGCLLLAEYISATSNSGYFIELVDIRPTTKVGGFTSDERQVHFCYISMTL